MSPQTAPDLLPLFFAGCKSFLWITSFELRHVTNYLLLFYVSFYFRAVQLSSTDTRCATFPEHWGPEPCWKLMPLEVLHTVQSDKQQSLSCGMERRNGKTGTVHINYLLISQTSANHPSSTWQGCQSDTLGRDGKTVEWLDTPITLRNTCSLCISFAPDLWYR